MHFDVIVAGGGAVGASFARAARGLSIALIAGSRPIASMGTPGDFDARVYALSPGNVEFLRAIKVWDSIPHDRVAAVRAMHVFGDAPEASIKFDAYGAGVPELAWIVEDRVLQAALWGALATQDKIDFFSPARCTSLELGEKARLNLEDGRRLEADLI